MISKRLIHSLYKESIKAFKLISIFFRLRVVKIFFVIALIVTLYPLVFFYIKKPRTSPNINYGVTFSDKYATSLGLDWKDTFTKTLDDMKIRNYRLVAYWDEIEAEKDKYNFDNIIWQLEEAKKRNAKVIMTIGRKVPRYPECFEPDWYKRINGKEQKEKILIEYIQVAVNTLKRFDNIVLWQVENEPQFPFGNCEPVDIDLLPKEIAVVRKIDNRPIITQDSGEAGLWLPFYKMADYLGISMYRKVWFDYWGLVSGKFSYVKYPIANWAYKIRAELLHIPVSKIIITELQMEPWGNKHITSMTREEKDNTLSAGDFVDTIRYAQGSGFNNIYLWGVEWWLWEKEKNNTPFFWDTAKALFNGDL
jgi:hypothetical protein